MASVKFTKENANFKDIIRAICEVKPEIKSSEISEILYKCNIKKSERSIRSYRAWL
jgi:hypothetical protein